MQSLLIEVSHWGLALIPVLVLLAVFDWLDAFELVNFKEILILLLLGGVAALLSWPVSGRLLDTLPIGFRSIAGSSRRGSRKRSRGSSSSPSSV